MRSLVFVAVLALVAVACGDDAAEPVATEAPPPTEAPATTSVPVESTTTTAGPSEDGAASSTTEATTTTRPRPEGEPAPDFTVSLGEGGTFTLSEEQKPVYMVFWAEW